jgi:hypothetical protein
VLFVLGEPLSGKSTLVSNLLNWLVNAGGSEGPRVRLIRWGDAMRAQRHTGTLPADRLPGDLSAAEFARLSAFVGELVRDARADMPGPGLVVTEFPGCTAISVDGGIDGLDRGFSTSRAFAGDEGAHYVAIAAEPRLRAMFLRSRETAPGDATNARSATPLAANRIHEQVTELMVKLHDRGRLAVPGVALGTLAAACERDSKWRDKVLFESFLPHLLGREIGAPAGRTLIARNVLLPEPLLAIAQPDPPFVDQFDYIRERYGI